MQKLDSCIFVYKSSTKSFKYSRNTSVVSWKNLHCKKNNIFVIMCSSFCFVLNITEEIQGKLPRNCSQYSHYRWHHFHVCDSASRRGRSRVLSRYLKSQSVRSLWVSMDLSSESKSQLYGSTDPSVRCFLTLESSGMWQRVRVFFYLCIYLFICKLME